MLAKTPAATAAVPIPPVVKRRIITLTNRSPVRITEDDWPVIAEGVTGDEVDGRPWGWKIEIHLREEKIPPPTESRFRLPTRLPRCLVYANYSAWDETEEWSDAVRVGRLVDEREATINLYKHILEVGDELRQRLGSRCMYSSDKRIQHEKLSYEKWCKNVTHAIDRCFASLPPNELR